MGQKKGYEPRKLQEQAKGGFKGSGVEREKSHIWKNFPQDGFLIVFEKRNVSHNLVNFILLIINYHFKCYHRGEKFSHHVESLRHFCKSLNSIQQFHKLSFCKFFFSVFINNLFKFFKQFPLLLRRSTCSSMLVGGGS